MDESSLRRKAAGIAKRLKDQGFQACFAGGCVRDQLLGKDPKDYDVATNATPDDVARIFPNAIGVGAHFGVMIVRDGQDSFEIATFRTDGSYHDGRKPHSVTFATIEEDAQRRDFTINGMFIDPVTQEVLDFVGGRKDLKDGTLRAIGNPLDRFQEDHLRLLRAVRFAASLNFEIEPQTWSAMIEAAPSIRRISPERIRDEFSRIMTHPSRVRGFDLLVDSGLMEGFLPEILKLKGCEQPPKWHPEGDVFVHTRLMLELLPEEVSLPLVLSVLLHDIGKPATYTFDKVDQRIRFNGHDRVGAEMTETILRRLRYSNEVIEDAVVAVANHMAFMNVQKMRVAKLKRFMARETFEDEMELHRVDCASSNGLLDNYQFLQEKHEEFANQPLIPPPLITGHDLIHLGWKPSPKFGEILEAVQTLQLEGELTDPEQAKEWVRANYPLSEPSPD